MFRLLCLTSVILVFVCFGCQCEKQAKAKGTIVLSHGGPDVETLTFPQGRTELLYQSSNSLLEHAMHYRKGELIFDKRGIGEGCSRQIAILNLAKREVRTIGKGILALWMESANRIIFYDHKGGLVMGEIENDKINFLKTLVVHSELAIGVKPFCLIQPAVVAISQSEILFEKKVEGRPGIWKYNVENGRTMRINGLTGCVLNNYVGLTSSGKIFCADYTGSFCSDTEGGGKKSTQIRYCTVNLDGTGKQVLEIDSDIYTPLSFMPENNSIVFSRNYFSWIPLGEKTDLWLYDLKTKKRSLLHR